MRRSLFGVLVWAIVPVAGLCQELVHFRSGFSLEVTSHSQRTDMMVLQVGAGSLEFPTADVESIEALSETPKAAPLPKTQPAISIDEALKTAAKAQGLEAELVRSVATIESRRNQKAVSPKGALGLMQLMPGTASELGVDPADAQQNARGGAAYLRALLLQYHGDSALALAAYNAGPAAVKKFHGVPPYAETRKYVVSVLREYERQLKSKPATEMPHGTSTPSATN